MGLVDRLYPDAAACREGAIEYAAQLAAGPSVAIGHAKLAITQGFGAPLDLGLAIEREAIGRVFASEDAEEGIKAFGEKRKAEFKGL
jgi:enoyl-CoA hydratase/carnithine racemase